MSDPIADLKHELLAAAERRYEHAAVPADRRPLRRHLAQKRLLLAAAPLSIAAVLALVFTAPWSNSPSFLARAEAALTPSADTVLHERWEVTVTSLDPQCTVTRGPNEIWIDATPPHRYRALLDDLPLDPGKYDRDTLACWSGTPSELGGTLDSGETLTFTSPNTLRAAPVQFTDLPDPVTWLRDAISAGTAHDEGKTPLDGRTVERIRIDPPSDCSYCSREPSYAYVDPETFYPVQTESPHGYIALPGRPVVRFHVIERYLTFEYLPRTAANLALTDIKAQHPDATRP